MIGKMHGSKHVCKNNCLSILEVKGLSGFLGNNIIGKTDGTDPKKRENYQMRTLKKYASFGLNIEESV